MCIHIYIYIYIYVFIYFIFCYYIYNIFVYMAHHFILLRLNSFGLRIDREGWWFEHSMSELRVCLSAEGAKNVSWYWLSLLWGWGSLTMAFTHKFVCTYLSICLPTYLPACLPACLPIYIFVISVDISGIRVLNKLIR